MLNVVDLCRLCAKKKRNKFNLFADETDEDGTLLRKIALCLSLQINRDDMLPKNVCDDCQRLVDQYHSFKISCQKAEERLNKMLSSNLPNKALVTIKQEELETDFHDSSLSQLHSPEQPDPTVFTTILKPVKNVKLEVNEPEYENEFNVLNAGDKSPDLIQIISEEMVHHNSVADIKQPVIEIISENVIEDFKDRNFIQGKESTDECNLKLLGIDEDVESSQQNGQIQNESISTETPDVQLDPVNVLEVKMQEPNNEFSQQLQEELKQLEMAAKAKKPVTFVKRAKTVDADVRPKNRQTLRKKRSLEGKSAVKKTRKRKELVESDTDIDIKYFLLEENEECDIDVEEMDALIQKKMNPDIRFNCKKCSKSFKFFSNLKKHRVVHDNEPESYICNTCCNSNQKHYEFSSLTCLKSHLRRKHLGGDAGRFQCGVCNKMLVSQGQLNAHYKKVHDNASAACMECGKIFKNKARLTDHLKVHREDRPFVCDQCGQSFKWSNGLKVHMQTHKQEKNFLCAECGKKFSSKKNLIEHLNLHAGRRPHMCKICGATFVQMSAYSKHIFTHDEGLKTHKCDKCDRAFSHMYLLRHHKLQHTGLRPYACPVCSSTFRSQADLGAHAKIHQEKQYPCTVCGRKFSRSKTLSDHMVRHTGVKHVCPAPGCGKGYTQRYPLTRHFSKCHPTLTIINRLGGKRSHLGDKSGAAKSESTPSHIGYDCKPRDEVGTR